ncbi:MAG: hypothetical protein Kow0077_30990 [Anaerolineae bacterium]
MKRTIVLAGLLLSLAVLFGAGCEPLVPTPTPQTIIITATPSPAPTPTATRTPLPTPIASATPEPQPSPTPLPCPEETGQIFEFDDLQSRVAGRDMPYRVYVPPCYFELQRRYPVVYLLHGAGETERQWEELELQERLDSGIVLGQYPPMIVVMPYGGSLLPDNDFDSDVPPMEAYLLDELIPRIETDFCVWEDRDHRAIGGISRGGFWALSIAFRHPERFGAVGAHSPALDTSRTPADFNPLNLSMSAPFIDTLRIYLDTGAKDPVRPEVDQLSTNLVRRQIPHDYVINPLGEHTDEYWAAHLPDYLAFYGGTIIDGWPRDPGVLPSCLEPSP